MERLKAGGLTLANMMIPWMSPARTANGSFPNVISGKPGRDEEIDKVRQSIRAAGRAGVPVVEYNFYAHRIVEGYYDEPGRGGAGMTAFDYDRVKDLPPLPEEGVHSLDEMWANVTYFLKAVVPIAEESGVRLALHPNDPPPPISRGSGQIMGSLDGWKRLIEIVPASPTGLRSIAVSRGSSARIRWRCAAISETRIALTTYTSGMSAREFPVKNTPRYFPMRARWTCSA
jgi:mannonate dehydratase